MKKRGRLEIEEEDDENIVKKEKLDECIHQEDWEQAEQIWFLNAKQSFIRYGKLLPSRIHFNEKEASLSEDGYGSLCCMLTLLGLMSYQNKKQGMGCNIPEVFSAFIVEMYVTYTLWLSYEGPLTKEVKKKLKLSFEKCYDFFEKIPKTCHMLSNKTLASAVFLRIFESGKFAAFWAPNDDLHELIKKAPQINSY